MGSAADPVIEAVFPAAFTIPTEEPESDGTLEWDSTTIVTVEVQAGGQTGLGWTYGHSSAAHVIEGVLAPLVEGGDPFSIKHHWGAMVARVRNLGRPGIAAHAISALDIALWDLKARLLDTSLARLLGAIRDEVPLYASGGFTSYSPSRLREQVARWADEGFGAAKIKVGRRPDDDSARVRTARDPVNVDLELMVDANGAYTREQALILGREFADNGVTWFEEPLSSDDLEGLHWLRETGPSGLEITAGEYGYDPWYFARMVDAGAVDVIQADATRCLGFTGFLAAAEIARGHHLPLSAHTAPQLHAHVGAGAPGLRHLEWFHDHVRIERQVFAGFLEPKTGALFPDHDRPGHGLSLKRADLERLAA